MIVLTHFAENLFFIDLGEIQRNLLQYAKKAGHSIDTKTNVDEAA